MRKIALTAALAQMLFGLLAIVPEIFGVGRMKASNVILDWVQRGIGCFGSFILALFLVVVYRTRVRLSFPGRARAAAGVAATSLAIENFRSTYASIRGVILNASDTFLWKYETLKEIGHVFVPLIPSFAVVSGIIFFAAVGVGSVDRSLPAEQAGPGPGLKSAALWTMSAYVLAGGGLVLHGRDQFKDSVS